MIETQFFLGAPFTPVVSIAMGVKENLPYGAQAKQKLPGVLTNTYSVQNEKYFWL